MAARSIKYKLLGLKSTESADTIVLMSQCFAVINGERDPMLPKMALKLIAKTTVAQRYLS
jgi:hypothetical protein